MAPAPARAISIAGPLLPRALALSSQSRLEPNHACPLVTPDHHGLDGCNKPCRKTPTDWRSLLALTNALMHAEL